MPLGALGTRLDPQCGALDKCSLVNLSRNGGPRKVFNSLPAGVTDLRSDGQAVTTYDPLDSGSDGWSIQCATNGKIDYVKYFIGGDVKTHYSAPFWVNGDNSGSYVNKFDLLSDCGEKMIQVKLYTWSGGDEFPCQTATLKLEAECPNTPTPVPCSNFNCPANSSPMSGKSCIESINDCTCTSGYEKKNGACVKECPNYQCPTNSAARDGLTCIRNFEDCSCRTGFEKKNGACVKKCPNYQCPTNSMAKTGLSCIQNFGDCSCITGFEKKNGACVKKCPNYRCPTNSLPKRGLACIRNFGDCTCSNGFEKKNGSCVKMCPNYRCPAYSRPKPGRTCIRSAADCVCNHGYELYNGRCTKKIPAISYCRRAAFYLHYRPSVPQGWNIEALRAGTHDRRFATITSSSATSVYIGGRQSQIQAGSIERWFHSFRFGSYYLRFRDNFGRTGPWKFCTYNTPIGLDIDQSGEVERIVGQFSIDITGDGDIEVLNEWFAPTEGILIDTRIPFTNGTVSGLHLFGNSEGFSDGFAKLHAHDDDVDGDVEGVELEGFAIWTDANSNAKVDEGELSTLASHGIVSLSTFHDSYVSSATLEDGSKMYMEDLWFSSRR